MKFSRRCVEGLYRLVLSWKNSFDCGVTGCRVVSGWSIRGKDGDKKRVMVCFHLCKIWECRSNENVFFVAVYLSATVREGARLVQFL